MPIKPLADRIAVELLPGTGKVGDLFVPGQAFCWAKVVAIGKDVKLDAAGGRMLVSEYFGDEIELDERSLKLGRERDVVGAWCTGEHGLRPPGDRVHVRRIDPPKMAGALHLPEDQHVRQFEAEVLAVGDDVECGLKPGQRVLVPLAVSVEVRLPDGKRFHLVDEPALLAIL